MTVIRLSLLAALAFCFAGCASQVRPAKTGDVGGIDRTQQRAMQAELYARDAYENMTPKTVVRFVSNPPGAEVEWYNDDGLWVTVGSTPSREVVIEATGKPELFRISLPGYLPQTRWVAATPSAKGVLVELSLQRELPADRFILSESR
ncbi:MAG: hypothetical protein HS108_15290 [Planctomycetes bacterium]|jgi:hypothetical protein|nr:hypothetical protein [Planctomycetota bacterium]MCL4730469.1 hypothetical protein [Planctomycetota bacterium]